MNGSDREDPFSANHTAGEPPSQIDEARNLFERMRNEAILQSKLESDAASSRGPLARGLLALTLVAVVLAVATLVYGIWMFPDAPIRATAGGYAGKGGTARTAADFDSFVVWQRALFATFPSAFIFGFAFAFVEARERRRKASKDRFNTRSGSN